MTTIPTADWGRIKAHLQRQGLMDHQGVTTTPKARHCRRCGAAVTAAIDDLGLTTAAHPVPTTTAGELAALLAGLHTFTLMPGRLIFRNARIIRKWSPDEYDVLVQHRCGMPIPPANPLRMTTRRKECDPNAPIPF